MLCKKLHTVLFCVVALTPGAFGQPDTYQNSLGMEFVLIRPGSMIVGKFQPPYPVPEDTVRNAKRPFAMWVGDGYNKHHFRLAKELALRDARPGFTAEIKKQFYIGKFEVTQEQWRKVMGKNPSTFRAGRGGGDLNPVESVGMEEIRRFIKKLNKLGGNTRYRLPTEFEWEYAARAGAAGDIDWKDTNLQAQLGTATTNPVGGKAPNPWGLYDMLGNVWEIVSDRYNGKLFADSVPSGKGKYRVLKGASFVGDGKNATYLTHAGGPGNGWDVGFRLVMIVDE